MANTVKPSYSEKSKVDARLKEKYPSMMSPGWGIAKKIKDSRLQMKGGSLPSKKQAASTSPGDAAELRKKFPGMFK